MDLCSRLPGRPILPLVYGLALLASVLAPQAGRADPVPPSRKGEVLVARTLAEVKSVREDLAGHEADFDELLNLRARIDPLRDELRALVADLDRKRAGLQARVAEIGAAPAGNAPKQNAPADEATSQTPASQSLTTPAADPLQGERDAIQKEFAEIEVKDKAAQVALASADGLWSELSELRRTAFTQRILRKGDTPLHASFWIRIARQGLPGAMERSRRVFDDEMAQVRDDGAGRTFEILAALVAATALGFVVLHRWIARRAAATVGPVRAVFERRPAVRQAFFVLLMRSLPLPLACAAFSMAEDFLDLSSDAVDLLAARIAVAALLIGLSRGIMAALLSPRKPHLRLVDCSDETAGVVYDSTILAANVFVVGILLNAYEDLISAPISVITATSLIVALGTIFAIGRGLVLLRHRPIAEETPQDVAKAELPSPDASVDGAAPEAPPAPAGPEDLATRRIGLNLGWLRPFLVLAIAVGLVAIGIGYVALAGFLMSRLTIIVLVVSLAILLGLFVDEVFGHVLSSTSPKGAAVARAVGLSGGVLDLVSTTLAGLVRLIIVFVALLFAFGPWGIRFGDLNPFNDALFAFSVNYVRFSIGTAAYSGLLFIIGLVGTRLIVGWLERRLLPLTTLDPGVRNSMTTIIGYVGCAITLLVVLSQLGVDPQKLAVVAGALSVGIGFGLQAITSNFISGLIVLAERPIRVGDIVSVKGEEGRVKKISVRSTLISGFDRTDIIVPNTDILTSIVRNKSLSDREFRLKVTMCVDQDADQDAVDAILQACAADHAHVLNEPPPLVFFVKASDAGLEFQLRCLIDDLDNTDRVSSDLHFEIVRRFRAAGIRLATRGGDTVAPAAPPAPPSGGAT